MKIKENLEQYYDVWGWELEITDRSEVILEVESSQWFTRKDKCRDSLRRFKKRLIDALSGH